MSEQSEAKAAFEAKLQEFAGLEIGPPEVAHDTVNEAMIRHWCHAMGDSNPIYTDPEAGKGSAHGGIVAPPAMMQAWTMPGIVVAYDLDSLEDKQRELHRIFGDNGYPSVVATNCEQGYDRYLRPGDRLTARTTIESVSEEKATALGIGYFVVTRTIYTDQNDEQVGWMTFRVLKFKPNQPAQPATDTDTVGGGMSGKPTRLRPPLAHDNAWWWEGVDNDKLLIQKCDECGVLRHPPRPMCSECQSISWGSIEASGRGTVHSYTVMHHPPIPGYDYPLAVALIDLEEGTRIISNVEGIGPEEVRIGMKVTCTIETAEGDFKLPIFHPAAGE
ncbi:MAG: bifunctional MaoC family dehydratase N-terminal/OB-fold nucleic acid binding domain-containing protein [Myxococcota bacterium]